MEKLRWEYRTQLVPLGLKPEDLIQERLNLCGDDGLELVGQSSINDVTGETTHIAFTCKRLKPSA